MADVVFNNVSKSYGAVSVVRDLNLNIKHNEFVALVGPSGCGKSTTLRMIAGLEEISSGAVSIGDRVVNDLKPRDRNIAMVFQNYALYPHMTVRENMSFGLRLTKTPEAEIAARVGEAARILNLSDKLDRTPAKLSGGERQRVAMGRAMVRRPDVFLFDEPLSNLDAKLRVQMRSEIKGLHQRLKTTTVFVTHNQVEAMTMADKIVVMRDGVIEQMGSPLDLYDKPQNTFVAGFIGSPGMNLIRGTAKSGGTVDVGGASLNIGGAHQVQDGQPVVYGIRPEHLHLADEGLSATVAVVEPAGWQTQVILRMGESEIVAVFHERHHFQPGQTIHLKPSPEHAHLFDSVSSMRI